MSSAPFFRWDAQDTPVIVEPGEALTITVSWKGSVIVQLLAPVHQATAWNGLELTGDVVNLKAMFGESLDGKA